MQNTKPQNWIEYLESKFDPNVFEWEVDEPVGTIKSKNPHCNVVLYIWRDQNWRNVTFEIDVPGSLYHKEDFIKDEWIENDDVQTLFSDENLTLSDKYLDNAIYGWNETQYEYKDRIITFEISDSIYQQENKCFSNLPNTFVIGQVFMYIKKILQDLGEGILYFLVLSVLGLLFLIPYLVDLIITTNIVNPIYHAYIYRFHKDKIVKKKLKIISMK